MPLKKDTKKVMKMLADLSDSDSESSESSSESSESPRPSSRKKQIPQKSKLLNRIPYNPQSNNSSDSTMKTIAVGLILGLFLASAKFNK